MLYVNKGLQARTAQWRGSAMNDRFLFEHNNDIMTVWMFQASGIMLHSLEIVYFNLQIQFIK